eukprot:TRINITY_DN46_c0_g1_i1.p1 TRINITY_DN46_c0_g1~~TRINITY_DN46_c0_g1_i1.p1  ORF type:complete len:163 (+),score=15.06 TRINITY_DN46_c0_g1_i1:204-692(+)
MGSACSNCKEQKSQRRTAIVPMEQDGCAEEECEAPANKGLRGWALVRSALSTIVMLGGASGQGDTVKRDPNLTCSGFWAESRVVGRGRSSHMIRRGVQPVSRNIQLVALDEQSWIQRKKGVYWHRLQRKYCDARTKGAESLTVPFTVPPRQLVTQWRISFDS